MNTAPIEFLQLGLDPHAFHYSDAKSWRGPCSQCGGTRRFVMFTNNSWPLWNGYCDECGMVIKAWEKVRIHIDPQKAAVLMVERVREEAEQAEKRRRKLAEFTTHDLWLELQERMTLEHVDWWESQGIPKALQEYLHIGYTADKAFYDDDKNLLHSPAYTIPWFGQGFKFNTMQYRLFADTDRRYIFEDGLGGGRFFYMTQPDQPIKDIAIICEGVKKSIVTQFWLIPSDDITVLGASSNNTFGAALEATKNCKLRYVIMDPGSGAWEKRAVASNPKTTHAIRLPYKIDDGWMKHGLDREIFTGILETTL